MSSLALAIPTPQSTEVKATFSAGEDRIHPIILDPASADKPYIGKVKIKVELRPL